MLYSCREARWLAALSLAAALAAAPRSEAAEGACDVKGVERVVAIGDVHGAYDNFVSVLKLAGLVDDKLRWSGGKARLVQTGDVLDRGPASRQVMDLLMRLEKESAKAGGRVHALIGNHEAMNLVGDLRYVSPEEIAAFRGKDSEAVREEVYRLLLGRAREQAKAEKRELDEKAYRAKFLEDTPLGLVEMRRAFAPEGTYGKWIRGHDAVVRIDGVVFLHGGLSPQVAALGCEAINKRVREELGQGIEATRTAPQETLAAGESGPLWYRGLAREEEVSFTPSLDAILQAMQARAIVVGHTPVREGRIVSRFSGRVVMIDAGMLEYYGGHLAALEITPEGMSGIYPTGRAAIEPAPLPQPAVPAGKQ